MTGLLKALAGGFCNLGFLSFPTRFAGFESSSRNDRVRGDAQSLQLYRTTPLFADWYATVPALADVLLQLAIINQPRLCTGLNPFQAAAHMGAAGNHENVCFL